MPEDDTLPDKSRDEEGKFLSDDDYKKKKEQSPIENLKDNTLHVKKAHDENTLVDVRVNNPLKKIVDLLEDIKKQKAFSFTLKGSLGIMGVALALSIFGVFGGNKLLCDKGIQSHAGFVKVLQLPETETSDIPLVGPVIDYYNGWFKNPYAQTQYRTILIKLDNSIIHLPLTSKVNLKNFNEYNVIATGQYDACSQTLKVTDSSGIQISEY